MKHVLKDRTINVLLVNGYNDEHTTISQLIKDRILPYNLILADSCNDAYEKYSTGNIDIILLEFFEDKQEYAQFLDKVPTDVPVIFLTNFDNQENAFKSRKEGIFDCIIRDPNKKYLSLLPLIVEKMLKLKEKLARQKNFLNSKKPKA